MAKIQIIAKTILAVLGIYTVLTILRNYAYHRLYNSELVVFKEILIFLVFFIPAALLAYFLIFKNDNLARKLSSGENRLNTDYGEQLEPAFMAKSLRIGLVFTGLMLLPGVIPTIVKAFKLFFLIRPALNEIIVSKTVPKIVQLTYHQWSILIYNILKAALTIYLIIGAPHFIRREVGKYARLNQPSALEGNEHE